MILFLYRVLSTVLYPFLLLLIVIRKIQKKEHNKRYKEKIFPSKFNIIRKKDLKLIWFHAASIGEMKSIFPIIRELNKNYKHFEFLITTTTLSSGNLAEIELKKFSNVQHRFFPVDVEFIVKIFLKNWKPNFIFLVDSEIWPNLILNAKKNKIPIAIINARITKKTSDRWLSFPKTSKLIFNKIDLCLSSNKETNEFFLKFNEKVYNTGNIKLISEVTLDHEMNLNEKKLKSKKFWIAASTHKNEEHFCLNAHLILKKRFNNLITVIAPRHIQRVHEIKKICDKFNLVSQVLNKGDLIQDRNEIVIINSFGALNLYFKLAKSVFIGKSTVPKLKYQGGQNPIDAANLGCKIYHGPYVYNFKEVYEILRKNQISEEIETYEDLANKITIDLTDNIKNTERFYQTMKNLREKTLSLTMKHINSFINNASL